jgi:hypothetical protein
MNGRRADVEGLAEMFARFNRDYFDGRKPQYCRGAMGIVAGAGAHRLARGHRSHALQVIRLLPRDG